MTFAAVTAKTNNGVTTQLAGKDVLDFGCGTGEISTQVAFPGARRVYALDVTQGLLDCTTQRAELDGISPQVETLYGFI
jgi:2-polyprenyl-3-methyl-5-hydroxy-6-metoxy-1,4-benzoquinol methylase